MAHPGEFGRSLEFLSCLRRRARVLRQLEHCCELYSTRKLAPARLPAAVSLFIVAKARRQNADPLVLLLHSEEMASSSQSPVRPFCHRTRRFRARPRTLRHRQTRYLSYEVMARRV